ncbi:MAG: hypothetical protein ACE5FU_01175 [Nitrospinota bacterium]
MITVQSGPQVLSGDFLEKAILKMSEKKEVAPKPQIKNNNQLFAPHSKHYRFFIFMVLMTCLLLSGWSMRDEKIISAETGFGYALGIIAAVLMLLLLLYPLRKKMRIMQKLGSIKLWFMAHMLFGVLGPVAALFHANFKTGSLNSSIIMYTTLLVAASGIIGRYVYTRIHYGLYGRLIDFSDLKKEMENNRSSLLEELNFAPRLKEKLMAFDELVLSQKSGILQNLRRIFFTGIIIRWTHFQLLRDLKHSIAEAVKNSNWTLEEADRNGSVVKRYISFYLSNIIQISYFRFYERIFSLWHLLHLPLFFLLILFCIVHVFMVHMF